MSEVVPDGFVLPDRAGAHVRAVMAAALDAVGVSTRSAGRDSRADREVLGLPRLGKVCVVLVDGLGMRMLIERGGHAPFLRSHLTDALTLTSTFPSTTAAAITSVGTGELPGATGMLGYSVREPSSGTLLNLVTWEGAPVEPRLWQERDTLFEQARRAGAYDAVSVGPARFVGSGLSEAALRGARSVSAESLADRVDRACAELARPEVSAVYLYWGEVDHTGHVHGWGSWQWGEEMSATDAELGRLAACLPQGTLLLVTADHGMVDLGADSRLDVATTPVLAQDVELVAGEPRACHVYTAPGHAEAVATRWRDVLGDTAWVLSRAGVEELDLLGPVDPGRRAAVGDVVVIMRGCRAVMDSRTQTEGSLKLVGVHGSLTPDEMTVPLVRVVV